MRTQQENETLNRLMKEEKQLTARWYEKMSEQVPWKEGERDWLSRRFEDIGAQIRKLWAMDTIEWFADLSDD